MTIRIHSHARERMDERGINEVEVHSTILEGEQFPAKFGRTGFRRNFNFNKKWRGRLYTNKQEEAFAVPEEDGWLVLTVIAKFY